jgi:hypothetical protein
MAAHALTIARQLDAEPDDRLLDQIGLALGAPGLDLGAGLDPSKNLYSPLYAAVERKRDIGAARAAITRILEATAFLDGYRCLEDANAAFLAFVRLGRPWWRLREALWFAGDPKAHRTAKPGSAPVIAKRRAA